jgi:hypothetical protein
MDRQARIGGTVLVKSREMTGKAQTLAVVAVGRRGKDDRKQIHWPRWYVLSEAACMYIN